jgi:hypothetical protein
MRVRNFTVILACVTLLVLVLSVPASLRNAYNRGGSYLFSRDFIEGIPKRLAGPGRFRFILQPLVAIILGIRNGLADARRPTTVPLRSALTSRPSEGACANRLRDRRQPAVDGHPHGFRVPVAHPRNIVSRRSARRRPGADRRSVWSCPVALESPRTSIKKRAEITMQ